MQQEFGVGAVFSKSLNVLFANFLPFMTIAGVVTLPSIALDIYDSYLIDTGEVPSRWLSGASRLLGIVLGPMTTGALTFGVLQQLRERHVSFGECLSVGFSRLLPVFAVAMLVGLAIGVGFILLIIPGLWLMCRLWVAIPVAVVERAGVLGAMNRSDELTAGSRWRIFGLAILILIVQIGLGMFLGIVMGSMQSFVGISIATALISIFASAWQASIQAVSYYTLRSMKEMIDVDQIAAVFD